MHLTDEQLHEYLDHETLEREKIEAHISSCADCAARLDALQDLFSELESLPEVELTYDLAARLSHSPSLPAKLPRSLTLTVMLQAALAIVILIVAAPFVMRFVSPYLVAVQMPSFAQMLFQVQSRWVIWLNMRSQFQMPALPEIPVFDGSSLYITLTLACASILWVVGNGLLLRKQSK